MRATDPKRIRLPRQLVELTSLRDEDGGPVRVWCERIAETRLLAIIQALPGLHPVEVEGEARPAERSPAEVAREIEALRQYAEPIIELGCRWEDGAQAFWFGAERDGAIPGRLLSDVDRTRLFVEVMTCCGFVGGPVEELRFPGGDSARVGDGVRAVEGGGAGTGSAGPVPGATDAPAPAPGV